MATFGPTVPGGLCNLIGDSRALLPKAFSGGQGNVKRQCQRPLRWISENNSFLNTCVFALSPGPLLRPSFLGGILPNFIAMETRRVYLLTL
jgi:hypothetical protein